MQRIACARWQDEADFVISAELALVSTIATRGMVSGLAEASSNVHNEWLDVGSAVGSLDQSFSDQGTNGPTISFSDIDHRRIAHKIPHLKTRGPMSPGSRVSLHYRSVWRPILGEAKDR